MKSFNVISCFDGLSGGQLAMVRAGLLPNNYYACEIDKYAMQVTKERFPNTIQLGDVKRVTNKMFRENYLEENPIDLLMGGSPCQGFSFAGKNLNFDDPRSKLFFEFVRIKEEFNPRYFLLENVKMKKESQDIISKYMGVEPIEINSSLVSAQNRKRLYWTNIPFDKNIKDKGIILKDIIEKDSRLFKGGTLKQYFNKADNKSECHQVGVADIKGHDILKRVYSVDGKSPTVNACTGGNREPKIVRSDSKHWRKLTPLECERLQTLPDNYTDSVSNTQRYKMIGNGWTVDVIAHILKGIK